MVHRFYRRVFTLFLGLVISSLANAENTTPFSSFFQENIQLLKANLLINQSLAMSEIYDNGIGDAGDSVKIWSNEAMCIERTVSNGTQCNDGYLYGFYLVLNGEDATYEFSNGVLKEYSDGTATLMGTIINNSNANIQFDVDIQLSGRTTDTGESPKNHDCFSASTADWYYYTSTEGSLIGRMDVEGGVLQVTRYAKAFQLGVGANTTQSNLSFGASGWLTVQILSQPSGSMSFSLSTASDGQHGDVNVNLSEIGTVCTEICDNGMDAEQDGRIDSVDDNCPIIVTTDTKNTGICAGDDVIFNIITNASNVPFSEIELYRFSSEQTNPYTATGDEKILIGKLDNDTGMGAIISDDFLVNNNVTTTYYVYALLSPPPSDLTDCVPFLEYIVSVDLAMNK